MIENNVKSIISSLPDGVQLVAAAKTRTEEEVQAAIHGGVEILGYNYLQEAENIKAAIKSDVQWHMIGHLQRNKVKKAVALFDMIETIDSLKLAELVNTQCGLINKMMPVLIEINSGKELNKAGVLPEDAIDLAKKISGLKNIRLRGLMTMGPGFGDPEEARVFFRMTKTIFDQINEMEIPNVDLQYLSMGMSNSYMVAIEEGANFIRIGTKLFGPR